MNDDSFDDGATGCHGLCRTRVIDAGDDDGFLARRLHRVAAPPVQQDPFCDHLILLLTEKKDIRPGRGIFGGDFEEFLDNSTAASCYCGPQLSATAQSKGLFASPRTTIVE